MTTVRGAGYTRTMQRKPVRYLHLIRRLGLHWLVVPVMFAAIFGGLGAMELRKSLLLAREGVAIEGVVAAKWIERTERDGHDALTHRLRYEYTPPERGTVLTRTETVSERRYQREVVGAPILVHYVWSRPETAALNPRGDRFGAVLFSFMAVLAGLVAAGMAVWMLGRKRSILRALRHGCVREARVTACRDLHLQVNKVAQFQLEWVDAVGATGQSLMAPLSKLSAHPPGSVIVVYLDPKTGRGWWEAQI